MRVVICTRCKEDRPEKDFSFRNKEKGIRHRICKPCQRVASLLHYQKNKAAYKARGAAFRDKTWHENRRKAALLARDRGCVDCGEKDPVVLEFDHRESKEKTKPISAMITGGYSWARIVKEIAKCDVRCANCHRRRTASQLGWWTLDGGEA